MCSVYVFKVCLQLGTALALQLTCRLPIQFTWLCDHDTQILPVSALMCSSQQQPLLPVFPHHMSPPHCHSCGLAADLLLSQRPPGLQQPCEGHLLNNDLEVFVGRALGCCCTVPCCHKHAQLTVLQLLLYHRDLQHGLGCEFHGKQH